MRRLGPLYNPYIGGPTAADPKGWLFRGGVQGPMDPRKGRFKHNGGPLSVQSRKDPIKGFLCMIKRPFRGFGASKTASKILGATRSF